MDEQEQQETSQVAPTPLPLPPSHKKLIIGIVAIIILVAISFFGYRYYWVNYVNAPSTAEEYFELCDLDHDKDCDADDISAFERVLGECVDGDNFNALADADNSGCINTLDQTILFPASIETSNWKTYRNEEYGFEFQYPTELISVPASHREIAPHVLQYVVSSLESNDGIADKFYYDSNKPLFTVFRFPSSFYETNNLFDTLSNVLEASADEHTTKNVHIDGSVARVEFYRTSNYRGDEVTFITEIQYLDAVYFFILSSNAAYCTYVEELIATKIIIATIPMISFLCEGGRGSGVGAT